MCVVKSSVKTKTFSNRCKKKSLGLVDIVLAIALISYTLGEIITIGGIKLSWIASILLIPFVAYKLLFKMKYLYMVNRRKRIIAVMIAMVLYSIISSFLQGKFLLLFSFNLSLAINIFIAISLIVLVKDIKDLTFCLNCVLIGILLNTFLGIYQMIYKPIVDEANFIGLPMGVYSNPNDFASVMYVGIMISTFKIYMSKRHLFINLFVIMFFAFFAVMTTSRLALIACMVLPFIVLWHKVLCSNFIKGKRSNNIYFYILSVIILILFILALYQTNVIQNIINLFSFKNSSNVISDIFRINILKGCVDVFIKSFLLGVSAGGSTYIIGINPHAFFFEMLADFGIIFFICLYVIFKRINCFDVKDNKSISPMLKTLSLMFFIISFLSSSAFRIRPIWIIFIAMILVTLFKYNQECTK